jgi:hypothetical protein
VDDPLYQPGYYLGCLWRLFALTAHLWVALIAGMPLAGSCTPRSGRFTVHRNWATALRRDEFTQAINTALPAMPSSSCWRSPACALVGIATCAIPWCFSGP